MKIRKSHLLILLLGLGMVLLTDFPVEVQGKISKNVLFGQVGEGGAEVVLASSNGSISINRK